MGHRTLARLKTIMKFPAGFITIKGERYDIVPNVNAYSKSNRVYRSGWDYCDDKAKVEFYDQYNDKQSFTFKLSVFDSDDYGYSAALTVKSKHGYLGKSVVLKDIPVKPKNRSHYVVGRESSRTFIRIQLQHVVP